MAKLKMFRGRWLMTLDHWLINLLSTNSHMDLITRLCKFNFTIINLSSDERFCCNTCWIELIVLNINSFRRFVDLTNIMIIGFSNSVSEWHLTLDPFTLALDLVDGNISPSSNLRLVWVAISKCHLQGSWVIHCPMCRESILSMLFFIHVLDILVRYSGCTLSMVTSLLRSIKVMVTLITGIY